MQGYTQNWEVVKSRTYVPTETTIMPLDEISDYVLHELIQAGNVPMPATEISINNEPNDFQPDVYRDICIQTDDTTVIRNRKEARHRRHKSGRHGNARSNTKHKRNKSSHANSVREEELDRNLVTVTVPIAADEEYIKTTDEHIIATYEAPSKVDENISPILGYADEPLLSLADACAPLTDLLHNLSFYVQLALGETPEEPPDGLTIDESAAIRLYTIEWESPHRSLYSMVNFHLKNVDREKLLPYFKYIKLFLTALVKLPCVPPLTVWRGVTKNLSKDFPPGTSVTWWAFSSCTTEMTVLENNMYLGYEGDRTLFSVEVMNGRTIKAHSHFVTEDEILLLSGTQMVVQSQLNPAPELHIIHLKQVIPTEPTLEQPFEGNVRSSNFSSKKKILYLGANIYPKKE